LYRRTPLVAAALALALTIPFAAEERIASDINAAIRFEGLNNSHVMRTLHVLTDIHGPRLTGSPSLKAAGEWAVQQLESWGLENGRLEPWEWGRPGWTNEFATGAILSPIRGMLRFEVLAWTPGTGGTVTGRAFHLIPPDRPTEADLEAYLESIAEEVAGAMVLVGPHRSVPVNFTPPAPRRTDEQLAALFDPAAAPAQAGGRRGARGAAPGAPQSPAGLTAAQVSLRVDRFLVRQRARVRINDAGRPHGQVAAFSNPTYDIEQAVPTVVLRNEDYGRISRILAHGTPVELQFTIVNQTHPEGRTAYNAIAEIPGTDLRDELVMIGAHLDSWHAATGATDNAVGSSVMMEVARILQAIGIQPRRTIRLALWSGEEQGLLGSQAYVAEHFGTFEDPKPDFPRLAAYLNIDHGTGRVRGASVFGPPAAAATMREILKPFADLGVVGAAAATSRTVGGTDHASFNRAGLTGINFAQDPIEYSSHTHHTNLDTYERVIEEDAVASAIVIASVVYHLAMRDEPLSRFSAAEMPAPRGR
jgi:carboxypeptidase Q